MVTGALGAVVAAGMLVRGTAPRLASTLSAALARRSDAGADGEVASDRIPARREVATPAVTVVGATVAAAVGPVFCAASDERADRVDDDGVAVRLLAPVDLPGAEDDVFDVFEPALSSLSACATADPDSKAAPSPTTTAPVPNKT
ncbi:hypothetical protein [Mycolicibacterium rhodesiae]|uniref:Uncharacterized protein n=1 Tax=Mycolicibacterium rhodesiae TaxID=36814 RepID=A0A1X0ISI2_MYCRH|nr:hypothetical protein [Mycolicibacterium rhodesiae]MCV7343893.1 hypothetical protein [Mycolicibacterium rhodesiae]ORB51188.1 hypothetical protein BST42_17320 [Mycolicibacterium rhodesiae]